MADKLSTIRIDTTIYDTIEPTMESLGYDIKIKGFVEKAIVEKLEREKQKAAELKKKAS